MLERHDDTNPEWPEAKTVDSDYLSGLNGRVRLNSPVGFLPDWLGDGEIGPAIQGNAVTIAPLWSSWAGAGEPATRHCRAAGPPYKLNP
jgi:hypothetical protein